MPRFWLPLNAAVLLVGSGCTEAPVKHTVLKVPIEDVRRDAAEAGDTATAAAKQSKADFEMRLKDRLADMEAEIDKLRERGLALKDEARAQWDKQLAELKAKQHVAREKLDELGRSTGSAWGHLEKGAQSAWEDLREAVQKAAKEF
jgi:hypothetical protein